MEGALLGLLLCAGNAHGSTQLKSYEMYYPTSSAPSVYGTACSYTFKKTVDCPIAGTQWQIADTLDDNGNYIAQWTNVESAEIEQTGPNAGSWQWDTMTFTDLQCAPIIVKAIVTYQCPEAPPPPPAPPEKSSGENCDKKEWRCLADMDGDGRKGSYSSGWFCDKPAEGPQGPSACLWTTEVVVQCLNADCSKKEEIIDDCDLVKGKFAKPCDGNDQDKDGIADDKDNCPKTPNPDQKDTDGFGRGDACDPDLDGDRLSNQEESVLGTNPNGADSDQDGLPDGVEVKSFMTNPLAADTDDDGLTDLSEIQLHINPHTADTDGDGLPDKSEIDLGKNPNDPTDSPVPALLASIMTVLDDDSDGDGIDDAFDNCPAVANFDQADHDRLQQLDTMGDACDPDDDNDGIPDAQDNCPQLANPKQADGDQDQIGDLCDPDLDNDGVMNPVDNCPFKKNPQQEQSCPWSDKNMQWNADGTMKILPKVKIIEKKFEPSPTGAVPSPTIKSNMQRR